MSRTLRPLAALAMVAMVALISAGCGTGSGSGDTTGANQETAASAAADDKNAAAPARHSGSKNASAHDKAVKFAECMRKNGVSAFPDPDASGDLTIDGVVNGSSVDPDGAAWKQAIRACKDLQPPGFTGSKATPKQMSARLKFAQCIRENGVKDFPDPTKDGPSSTRIASRPPQRRAA